MQGAIGDIDSAIGNRAYTNNYLLADSQSVTASLEAIDSAFGNRTYTQDNYVTDSQSITASIDALDIALDAIGSGESGIWRDQGTYIYPSNYTSFAITDAGNLGIGTTNPTYKLDVVGDIRASSGSDFYVGSIGLNDNASTSSGSSLVGLNDDAMTYISANTNVQSAIKQLDSAIGSLSGGAVTGSGNIGYLTKWSTTTNLADSVLFEASSNIGIGLTNPGYKLDVAGDIRASSGSDFYVGSIGLNDNTSLSSGASLVGLFDNTYANISANTTMQGAIGDIDSAIGNRAYTNNYLLADSQSVTASLEAIDSAFGNRTYTQDNYVTDSQSITASIDALDIALDAIGSGESGIWRDQGTYIYPSNYTSFAITDAGNLGIGTTNPTYKLDVVGDIRASSGSDFYVGSIGLNDNASTSSGSSLVGLNDDAMTYISANTNVQSAIKQLDSAIGSLSGGAVTGSGNIGYLTKWSTTTNLADSVLFEASSNIGIGLTNPGYKLDVAGDIRASSGSDFYVGSIGLNDNTSLSSGASLVGLFDNTYANISANTTMQGAIGDIDSAIGNRAYTNNYLLADSQSVTASLEAIDSAFGNRTYTQDNYVTDSQSITASIDALDIALDAIGSGESGIWRDQGTYIYPSNYTSFAITDAGNLGIGTTNPTYKLDVVGDIRASSGSDFYVGSIGLNDNTSLSSGASLVGLFDNTYANISANTTMQGAIGDIDSAIGNRAYTNNYLLADSQSVTASLEAIDSAFGNRTYTQDNYVTDSQSITASIDALDIALDAIGSGESGIWRDQGTYIYPSNYTSFAITDAGNLGIGTTNPTYKLDVVGDIRASSGSDFYVGSIGLNDNASTSSGSSLVGLNDDAMTYISANTNVQSAIKQLDSAIGSLSGGAVTGSGNIGYLTKWSTTTNLADSVLFEASSNIGIGLTNPGYKLDVAGDIRASSGSDFYVGSIGLNDNTSLSSGASLVGLFDNTYANISANTTMQGAIGDIDSAIGNRAYTNNYLLADSQSVTASLEAIDSAFGNRTYTQDNYVTDSQSITASIDALDIALDAIGSGESGIWRDQGTYIYPSNYTSFAITDAGNLGIGTTNPTYKLDVVGDIRASSGSDFYVGSIGLNDNASTSSGSSLVGLNDDAMTYISANTNVQSAIKQLDSAIGSLSGGAVTGSGNIGYLTKWSTTTNLADSVLFEASSNIGIGLTNPGYKLDVAGDIRASSGSDFYVGSIGLNDNTSLSSGASLVGLFDNTYANISANTTMQGAIGDIDSAIGNRAYTNNYLLADSQSVTASLEAIDSAFGNRTYTQDNYVTDSQSITASIDALDIALDAIGSGESGIWRDQGTYIYPSNYTSFAITDAGNLGIGTTNPTYKLDVVGDIRASSGSDFYVGSIGLNDNASTSSGSSLVGLNDDAMTYISANTNVQSAIKQLDSAIGSLSGGAVTGSGNIGYLTKWSTTTNLADSVLFEASSNIGIGLTNPGYKLDVAGDIRASSGSDFYVGSIGLNDNTSLSSGASLVGLFDNTYANISANTTMQGAIGDIDSAIGNRAYTNNYLLADSQSVTASLEAIDSAFGNRTYTQDNYVTDSQSITASIDALDIALDAIGSGESGIWRDQGTYIYPSNYTSFAITDAGNLGIGTTNPTYKLDVVGDIRASSGSDFYVGSIGLNDNASTSSGSSLVGLNDDAMTYISANTNVQSAIKQLDSAIGSLSGGAVTGSGNIGYLTKWSTTTNLADSVLFEASSNIGIGLTNPGYKLDVAGDIRASSGSDFYVGSIGLNDNTSLSSGASLVGLFDNTYANISANTTMQGAIGDIDSAIGNRAYTNNYLLADSQSVTASLEAIDSAFGNRTYTQDNYVTDSQSITASIDALDIALDAIGSGESGIWRDQGTYIYPSNYTSFAITDAGNLGIGTTNPTYKLDVVGDIRASSGSDFYVGSIGLNDNASTSSGSSLVGLNDDAMTYISANTNVQSAIKQLDSAIGSLSGGAVTGSGNIGYLTKWSTTTNLADSVLFEASSNIGIGLTNPGYKLDVAGDIRASSGSDFYVGSIGLNDNTSLSSGASLVGLFDNTYANISANTTMQGAIGDIDSAIGNRAYTNNYLLADSQSVTASLEAIDSAFGNRTYTQDNYVTDSQSITASIDALDIALDAIGSGESGIWRDQGTYIYPSNYTSFAITDAGNLGIGTTNPTYKLDVVGDIRASSGSDFYVGSIGLNDNASTSSGSSLVGLNDDAMTYISANTNVQSAIKQLDSAIGSLSGGAVTGSGNIGYLTKWSTTTNLADSVLFEASSNIGIGLTNPGYKLDVAGDIRASSGSDFYVGSIGLNDNTSLSSGASLVGLFDNTYANISANTTMQGAIGDIDSAIGNRAYTNNYLLADSQSVTASLEAIDSAFGNRTYTQDNYVTDSQSITASIDALDIALDAIGSGESGIWRDQGTYIYPSNYTSFAITDAGNLGIGTTNPTYKLDVVGDIRASSGSDFYVGSIGLNDNASTSSGSSLVGLNDDAMTYISANTNVQSAIKQLDSAIGSLSGGAVTGSGNIGYLTKWSTTTNLADSVLFEASSNIGIGLTNPGYKLDVAGDIRASSGSDFYVGSIGLNDNTSLSSGASLVGLFDNTYANISANTTMQGAIGDIDSAIGNRAYTNNYLLADSQSVTASLEAIDSAFGNRTYTEDNYVVDSQSLTASVNALDMMLQNVITGSTGLWIDATGYIYANNTSNIVVADSGNLGLGTTNPADSLYINSSVNGGGLTIQNSNSNAKITFVRSTGNVTGYIQSVNNNGLYISQSQAYPIVFDTNATEAARITSLGNFGLGTSAPAYKLDVNGDARVASGSDFYVNTVGLNDNASTSSGSSLVGLNDDAMTYISANTNVQSAIKQLDSAIGSLSGGAVTGSGNIGYLTKWSTTTNLADSVLFEASSNIGIGLTNPGYKLDVAGDIRASSGSDFYVGLIGLNDNTTASSGASLVGLYDDAMNYVASNTSVQSAIKQLDDVISALGTGESGIWRDQGTYIYPSNYTSFVITDTGRLGVGTTTPAVALEVVGEIRGTRYAFQDDTNTYIDTQGADEILFATNGSTKLLINANGNLGIGNTLPTYKLDVNGDIRIAAGSDAYIGTVGLNDNTTASSGSSLVGLYDDAMTYIAANTTVQSAIKQLDSAIGSIGSGESGIWRDQGTYIYPSNYTSFVITDTGNVGIGTTNPTFALEVNGTGRVNGNFTIGDASGDSLTINAASLSAVNASTLDLANSSTTSLNIESGLLDFDTSNARIGIGTTAPAYKLDVNGDIRIAAGSDAYIGTVGLNDNTTASSGSSLVGLYDDAMTYIAANTTVQSAIKQLDSAIGSIGSGESGIWRDQGTYIYPSNYTSFVITDTGNVGIGTTNPTFALEVNGTGRVNGNFTIGDASGDSLTINAASLSAVNASTLDLANSSTTSLNIESGLLDFDTSNARIGIGTTAPAYKLDVNGDIRIAAGSDAYIGTVGLNDNTTASSGSSLVGLYDDAMTYIAANTTVQSAIKQLDSAIGSIGSGESGIWRDQGTYIYPSNYTSFVITDTGNVGIGTTNPTFALEVNGTGRVNGNFTIGDASGDSLTINAASLSAVNASTLDLANSSTTSLNIESGLLDFDTSNARIGIGTTAPAYKLDVNGDIRIAAGSDAYIGTVGLNDNTTASSGSSLVGLYDDAMTYIAANTTVQSAIKQLDSAIGSIGSGESGIWRDQGTYIYPSNYTSFVITDTGNVGIGTTNPTFALEVNGTGRVNGNFTIGDASGDSLTINAASLSAVNASTLDLANSSTTSLNIESGLLDFDTSNARIGIGTTAPAYKLDVNGDIRIAAGSDAYIGTVGLNDNTTASSGSSLVGLYDDAMTYIAANTTVQSAIKQLDSAIGSIGSGESGIWRDQGTYIYPSNYTSFVITDTGNVGIGTTNPTFALEVNGTGRVNGNFTIGDASGDSLTINAASLSAVNASTLDLANSSTTSLNIESGLLDFDTSNARIGIGTTAPAYKLDVNGDIRIAAGSDAYIGTVGLNDNTTASSGSSLVGLYDDAMTYIAANTTVQSAIKQLDSAIGSIGSGESGIWRDQGTYIYPSNYTSFVITDTGNVGIGTTNPTFALEVNGTGRVNGNFTIGDASGDSLTINAASLSAVNASTLDLANSSTTSLNIESGLLDFDTSNARIGIGTTAPAYKLDVNGDIRIAAGSDAYIGTVGLNDNTTASSGSSLVGLYDDAMTYIAANTTVQSAIKQLDSAIGSIGSGESGIWRDQGTYIYPSNYTSFVITDTGNVGIGTTNPTFALEVNGTGRVNGNFTIGDASGDSLTINAASLSAVNASTLDLANSSTTSLNIESGLLDFDTSNARIGIGTTAPAYKLDVNGDIRIAAGSDAYIGTVGLNDNTTASSGSSLVGLYDDAMTYIAANTTVQSAIKQLDSAIGSIGSGESGIWRDQGTYIYPSNYTSFVITDTGNVGIGTTNPTFALEVNGTGRVNGNFTIGDASGDSLTINAASLSAVNASTLDLANSSTTSLNIESGLLDFDTSNARIGIGTTAPAYKLDVNGDIRIAAGSDAYIGTVGLNDNTTASSGSSLVGLYDDAMTYIAANTTVQSAIKQLDSAIGSIGSGESGIWRDQGTYIYPSNYTSFVITDTGNVGIGTTNPTFALEVNGTGRVNGNFTIGDASGDSLTINAASLSAVNASTLDLANSSTTSLNIESGLLDFDTSNARIGIGTTAPAYKLDVNGDIRIAAGSDAYIGTVGLNDNTTASSGSSLVGLYDDAMTYIAANTTVQSAIKQLDSAIGSIGSGESGIWRDQGTYIYPSNYTSYVITDAGRLGIGTTAPNATLEVVGDIRGTRYAFQDDTNTYIDTQGADEILFATNGSTKLLINSNGNLGIGTTLPTYKLDVNGDARVVSGSDFYVGTIGLNDNTSASSGASLIGLYDNTYANIGSSTTVQGAIGEIDSVIGARTYTNDFVLTDAQSLTLSLDALDATIGNRTYSQNNFVTDAQNLTLSIEALDIALGAIESGESGIWRDATTYIYPSNYSSFVITDTGNVGIGTTTPAYKLDVNGDIRASSGSDFYVGLIGLNDNASTSSGSSLVGLNDDAMTYISANTNVQSAIKQLDSAIGSLSGGAVTGSGNIGYISKWSTTSNLNDSVLFQASSNIGIGTTAPNATLEVVGDIRGTRYAFQDDTNTYIDTQGADEILFATNGSTKLLINSNGNLGIGTTLPTYKLDVNGDARVVSGSDFYVGTIGLNDNTSASSGASLIGLYDNTYANIGSSTTVQGAIGEIDSVIGARTYTNDFVLTDAQSLTLSLDALDATIGNRTYSQNNFVTDAQNLTLSIEALDIALGAIESGESGIWRDATTYIYPSNYSSFVITDTGNVGIGTTTPSSALEVVGNIELDEYLYFDNTTSEYLQWNTSDFVLSDSLLPSINDALDLGSTSLRWQGLYLGPDTLHIGSSTTDEGTISYNTTSNVLGFSTDSTTNGDIAFFTNQLYLDKSTGNIGIGTTTPTYKLSIDGSLKFTNNQGIYFRNATDTADNIAISYTSGNNLQLYGGNNINLAANTGTIAFDTNYATQMTITNLGNVGIGITAPTDALHVYTTISGGGLKIQSSNNNSKLTFARSAGNVTGYLQSVYNNAMYVVQSQAYPMVFQTNSAEAMRLTSLGNLGVGNTNPVYKLDIGGDIHVATDSDLYIGSIGVNDSGASNTTSGAYLMGVYPGNLTNSTATNLQAVLEDLDAAIGTGSTGAGGSLWTDTSSLIYANNATSVAVTDTGRLGVGTTAPSSALEVVGNIELSNYVYFDNSTSEYLRWDATDFILSDSLLPSVDDGLDLGSSSYRWQDLYLGPSTLHIGSTTSDEGTLSYNTTTNVLNISTDATTNGDVAIFNDDLYVDKSSGNIGIGTTAPTQALDILR